MALGASAGTVVAMSTADPQALATLVAAAHCLERRRSGDATNADVSRALQAYQRTEADHEITLADLVVTMVVADARRGDGPFEIRPLATVADWRWALTVVGDAVGRWDGVLPVRADVLSQALAKACWHPGELGLAPSVRTIYNLVLLDAVTYNRSRRDDNASNDAGDDAGEPALAAVVTSVGAEVASELTAWRSERVVRHVDAAAAEPTEEPTEEPTTEPSLAHAVAALDLVYVHDCAVALVAAWHEADPERVATASDAFVDAAGTHRGRIAAMLQEAIRVVWHRHHGRSRRGAGRTARAMRARLGRRVVDRAGVRGLAHMLDASLHHNPIAPRVATLEDQLRWLPAILDQLLSATVPPGAHAVAADSALWAAMRHGPGGDAITFAT